ncbi:MAG: hypothetical protein Q4P20_00065 [Eubacteriales bacterium]|nr:hypothetical protein [Eubacteriales bacterium]
MKTTKYAEGNTRYVTAAEVAEAMGVCLATAYTVIKKLNAELNEKGYITVRGKVSRKYFEERCMY